MESLNCFFSFFYTFNISNYIDLDPQLVITCMFLFHLKRTDSTVFFQQTENIKINIIWCV